MRSRRSLKWLAAAALALALAACSDDDAPDNNGVIPDDDAGDVTADADAADDAGPDVSDAEDDVSDAEDDVSDAEDDVSDGGDVADGGDVQDGGTTMAPLEASAQTIADVAGGAADTTIEQVAVTYTRQSFGSDDAGFFIQATQDGPALFVAVDPTTTDPALNVGDIVTLDAVTVETDATGRSEITEIANLSVLDSGYDVTNLVQDVTDASDLVSALDDYSQELVTADIEIVSDFGGAGAGHLSAEVDTTAIQANEDLALRIPTTINDQDLGLINGCTLTVGPTPLWRFFGEAQLSIWDPSDASSVDCPAASALTAQATADDTVELLFNRPIDASSISNATNQFTITPALNVTAASVDGKTVTLTTATQTGGTEYTVEVANSVQDIGGNGIDQSANSATFTGYVAPAQVVINEVSANITNGCDLVELRVTQGGSLDGFELWERTSAVASFSGGLQVQTNDIVVVHFNAGDTANCNPNNASSEISAVDEVTVGENYDTAWDWWTQDGGITRTNNVLSIYDPSGAIVDAVFLVDESACTGYDTAGGTETQATTVGGANEWELVSGGQPSGTWMNEEFCSAAAPDLDDTGTSASGTSIQRSGNADTNKRGDWSLTNITSTFGEANVGQTPF